MLMCAWHFQKYPCSQISRVKNVQNLGVFSVFFATGFKFTVKKWKTAVSRTPAPTSRKKAGAKSLVNYRQYKMRTSCAPYPDVRANNNGWACPNVHWISNFPQLMVCFVQEPILGLSATFVVLVGAWLTNKAKPRTFSNFLQLSEIISGPWFKIGEKKISKTVQIQQLPIVNDAGFAVPQGTRPQRCHTCQFMVDLGQDFFCRQLIHQGHYLGSNCFSENEGEKNPLVDHHSPSLGKHKFGDTCFLKLLSSGVLVTQ